MSFIPDRFFAPVRERSGLLPFLGAVATWTLLWTVLGVQDVLEATALGQGRLGGALDIHEVMEVVFVAAYTGVRWAAGMALLLGGGLVIRWGMRLAPPRR